MDRRDIGSEIRNAIRDQITFIKNSSHSYDNGCLAESIRIASALNVLLEERRNGSVGLLRSITNSIKIFSSVPDTIIADPNRVITSSVIQTSQVEDSVKSFAPLNNKFLLIYSQEDKSWYVHGHTKNMIEITCAIGDLGHKLGLKMMPRVQFWIKKYSNNNSDINDIGKRIILQHLSILFGYEDKFASGLYFPMIKTHFGKNMPTLSYDIEKYLDQNTWLDEVIYAISDSDRQNHTLTRRELINSARDQDGGGHFDTRLDIMGYYKSKYGEVIGQQNGNDISTKNFHLIMLRQLGYEILKSPTITDI